MQSAQAAPEDPPPGEHELQKMKRMRWSIASRESAGEITEEPSRLHAHARVRFAALRGAISLSLRRVVFNKNPKAEPLSAFQRQQIQDWIQDLPAPRKKRNSIANSTVTIGPPSPRSAQSSWGASGLMWGDEDELMRSPSFQSDVNLPPQRLQDSSMIVQLQDLLRLEKSPTGRSPYAKTWNPLTGPREDTPAEPASFPDRSQRRGSTRSTRSGVRYGSSTRSVSKLPSHTGSPLNSDVGVLASISALTDGTENDGAQRWCTPSPPRGKLPDALSSGSPRACPLDSLYEGSDRPVSEASTSPPSRHCRVASPVAYKCGL